MKKRYAFASLILAVAMLCSACSNSAGAPSSAPETAASSAEAPMEAGSEPAQSADYAMPESEAAEWFGDEKALQQAPSGESYLVIDENPAKLTSQESMLTFSLKVDTAAYSNVERYIANGSLPPRDAVRTEEMLNYFSYDETPERIGDSPFSIYTEVGPSPFDESKNMALVRVKTDDIDKEELPSSNLTFLIDTSGSMHSHDKLPLLKDAFRMLVDTLGEDDIISIVTYAGSSSIELDSVSAANKEQVLRAIDGLEASGSTAGANGIGTAYELAAKNFIPGGNNRVLLATDGDFNVGMNNVDELAEFIAEKKETGVYLSILGFGTGNIRDDIMETLSKNGNGNYSYIHTADTARKVLVDELGANLFTVADDVKAQVHFNPANVKGFRLIGYENRALANKDFEDDTKDAGEIGAGTDVIMLFELELVDKSDQEGNKYVEDSDSDLSGELFEVRIRYKDPGESESKPIAHPVPVTAIAKRTSSDYNFACSVAAFGHLLRDSEYLGEVTIDDAISMAKSNLGKDEGGYRVDYLVMLKQYKDLI